MGKKLERRVKTKNNEEGKLLCRGKTNSRVLIDGEKESKLVPTNSFEILEVNRGFSLEGFYSSENKEK